MIWKRDMKTSLYFLLAFFYVTQTLAQTENIISTNGDACEAIKNDESKASARVRAIDKASFTGVENLPQLQKYKNNLNSHDFNVMIYGIVDEFLENTTAKTISEDEKNICVSVSGQIKEHNLNSSIEKSLSERGNEAPTDMVFENIETSEDQQKQEEFSKIPDVEERGLVYIAPTTFYNGATSDNHSKLLKHLMGNSNFFYITDNMEIADFVVYTNVEKAKVEVLDENSSKLQMVIVFRLISSDGNVVAEERQSRTIVFDKSQTEQQNAQKLLKSMYAKASKRFLNEIEKIEQQKMQ